LARVFVVYDEPITRLALQCALTDAGFEVVVSASGCASQVALSTPHVDIIVGSAVGDLHGTAGVIAAHPSAQVVPLGIQTAGCDLRDPFLIPEVIRAVKLIDLANTRCESADQ
jgi:DNA-binding response OmpR family regulator